MKATDDQFNAIKDRCDLPYERIRELFAQASDFHEMMGLVQAECVREPKKRGIVITFEEPESSHSDVIATFDGDHYPVMMEMYETLKQYDGEYPGPYFSIRDVEDPPHNPIRLSDFIELEKLVQNKKKQAERQLAIEASRGKPFPSATMPRHNPVPAEFGKDTTLEPPELPF